MYEDEILAGRIVPGMNFHQQVWAATVRIPAGRVMTYGDLASLLRGPTFRGYRAVGQALNRNPYAPRVPCHRVVGSDGRLTGFARGLAAKRKLLESEGVAVASDRVDLKRFRCTPGPAGKAASSSTGTPRETAIAATDAPAMSAV